MRAGIRMQTESLQLQCLQRRVHSPVRTSNQPRPRSTSVATSCSSRGQLKNRPLKITTPMIVIANHTAVCISAEVTPSRAMYFSETTYRVMPTAQPSAERPTSGHDSCPACQILAAYTKPSESAKPDNTIRTSTSTGCQLIEAPEVYQCM